MFNEINRYRLIKGISLATKYWGKATGPCMLTKDAEVLHLGKYGYLYNHLNYTVKGDQSITTQQMTIRQKKNDGLILEHFHKNNDELTNNPSITTLALDKNGKILDSVVRNSAGIMNPMNDEQKTDIIRDAALLLASPSIMDPIKDYNYHDNLHKNKGQADYELALSKAHTVIKAAIEVNNVVIPGLRLK